MPIAPSNAAPTDNTAINIALLLVVLLIGVYLIWLAFQKSQPIDPPDWWNKPWDSEEPKWPIRPESPAQLGGKYGSDGR